MLLAERHRRGAEKIRCIALHTISVYSMAVLKITVGIDHAFLNMNDSRVAQNVTKLYARRSAVAEASWRFELP